MDGELPPLGRAAARSRLRLSQPFHEIIAST